MPTAPDLVPSEPVPQHWDVIITVDPSLYRNPDPAQPCPVQAPERTFPLDMDENLVGRRSEKKDIHPEINNFVTHGAEGLIVMEYVGGKPIKSLRKEHGPLPAPEAIAYILGILPAFSYLHVQGIAYCDFKPATSCWKKAT